MIPFNRLITRLGGSYLFMLGAVAAAVVNPCERRLIRDAGQIEVVTLDKAEVYESVDEFKRDSAGWIQEILGQASTLPDRFSMPESFRYQNGVKQRFENAEAADKLRKTLFLAVPDLVTEVSQNRNQKYDLNGIFARLRSVISNHYGAGAALQDVVKKQEKRVEKQWSDMRQGFDLAPFQFSTLDQMIQRYLGRFTETRARFSPAAQALFDQSVQEGAAFGNLGSGVILSTLKIDGQSDSAVMALTLLHPLTDNALDQGQNIGDSMKKISRLLKGEKQEASNPYEEVVFTLIEDIFKDYPRETHPLFAHFLDQLHQAQLMSVMVQKSQTNVSPEDLLKITFMKGAYTSLCLSYLSIGTLRKDEIQFYFKSGLLFQMGDDLMDVEEDFRDGVKTLWTTAFADQKTFERRLILFAHIQNYLEKDAARVLENNPLKKELANNLRLGFLFYLYSTLQQKGLDDKVYPHIKRFVPLSPQNTRAIAFSLFKALLKESSTRNDPALNSSIELLGRIYDRHFLGGGYSAFDQRNQGRSARRSYRISHPNPYFLFVKFGNRLASGLTWLFLDKNAQAKPEASTKQIFSMTGMLFLYTYIPTLIQNPGLADASRMLSIVGIAGFMTGFHDSTGPGASATAPPARDRRRLLIPFFAMGASAYLRLFEFFFM